MGRMRKMEVVRNLVTNNGVSGVMGRGKRNRETKRDQAILDRMGKMKYGRMGKDEKWTVKE